MVALFLLGFMIIVAKMERLCDWGLDPVYKTVRPLQNNSLSPLKEVSFKYSPQYFRIIILPTSVWSDI